MYKWIEHIQNLGQGTINFLRAFGRANLFILQIVASWPKPKLGIRLLIKQLYSVGVLSLVIIVVSGTFVGMVLALQGYTTLLKFGAELALGPMIALALVRELGPVMTALLFAGRAGSALTAEIGLMRATEQLSSMDMMAVDPLKRVIAPRFWAGVISMPLLAIIFSTVGVWGGTMVGVYWLGVDEGAFWANMQSAVDWHEDIWNGIIKSAVFGVLVTWLSVFHGFYSIPTSEGVSAATTRTVVQSSLVVLAMDFILTALMFGGFNS